MLTHQAPLPIVPSPQPFLKVPVWKNGEAGMNLGECLPSTGDERASVHSLTVPLCWEHTPDGWLVFTVSVGVPSTGDTIPSVGDPTLCRNGEMEPGTNKWASMH